MPRISRRGFLGGALIGITNPLAARAEPSASGLRPDQVVTQFFCNGEEQQSGVDAATSALDVIRQLGHTGTKRSCGTGACGACTVLVDGEPQVTCILPATSLEGRSVTTVEGIAVGPAISQYHPVQRAFLAEDALQCGYCTPGFIVEAAAFHDRWRATHGTVEPDRGAIARALSGHLCRCGAYPAIYRAIAAACRGDHDTQRIETPRVDGPAKVTGAAQYTTDIHLDGMLEAHVLRAQVAHGVVRSIQDARALKIDGVKAIYHVTPVGKRIRFVGQELVAVAAVDSASALRALNALVVDVQALPASITVGQAQTEGAPQVYDAPRHQRSAPHAGENPPFPARWEGNVRGPAAMSFLLKPGRARRGLERAKYDGRMVKGQWQTQVQSHTSMEPHAAIAHFRTTGVAGDAVLEVWASTQSCAALAEDLAQRFRLKRDQVVVHCPFIGGAFGAKFGLQPEIMIAVELARAAEAPVKVVLSREEELMVGGTRPGQRLDVALSTDLRGDLTGLEQLSVNDGGVAIGHASGLVARLMYATPARNLKDFDVVTHTPPAHPFRGPGGPPSFFALEGAADQLAHDSDRDPLGLRQQWDRDPIRARLYDWVGTLPVWRDRGPVNASEGRFRRGVGLATGAWFHLWDPSTQVELEAGSDGIVVRIATQDVGTGTRSLIAEVVASKLGLVRTDIRVELGESSFKHGPAASGSMITSSVVPAAEHATEELIDVLAARASAQGIEGELEVTGIRPVGGKLVPWRELLKGQPPVWTIGRRRADFKPALLPFAVGGAKTGRVNSAVAQVSEVEVDMVLGRVRVREVWIGIAAGRIFTPVLARSQVEGAVVQGISYTLFEERRLDPRTGHLLTHSLDDYQIAGIGDIPEINVHFEDSGFDHVRGGGIGLGELGTVAVAASIANGVFHATGVRPQTLPLRPQTMLGLLQ